MNAMLMMMRRRWRGVFAVGLVVALAACSAAPAPETADDGAEAAAEDDAGAEDGGGAAEDPADDADEDTAAADDDGGEDTDAGDGEAAELDPDAEFGEAPDLAEQAETGDLPPVDERLPSEPLVVPVVDRIGEYGGTWNRAESNATEMEVTIRRHVGYERLYNWTPEWEGGIETTPNVATDVEVNDEGTEFTFTLREGIRWSDGEPFTADDIVFALEDCVAHDLLCEGTNHMESGGPPEMEAVDDHTVRFTFSQPHGLFLQGIAEWAAIGVVDKPRHYLEEFHESYNDDIDELVDESGYSDWVDLFNDRADAIRNPDLPVIHAWQVTEPFDGSGNVVFERNPYYWKVDPEGQQLPYIDRHVIEMVEDEELILLQAMNGELDMQHTTVGAPRNRAVLMENAESGDYRLFDTEADHMNTMAIHLNQTHEDEHNREMFGNKDFRIGLSHAINREEIIDAVYFGQGEPWQIAPTTEMFYDEELAKQYTEYDVDLANEHLDAAGYEMDDDGRRIGPDGEPITINVDFASDVAADWSDALELVREHWAEVGVDLELSSMTRTLHTERVRENGEHEATVWTGSGGMVPFMQTHWYFPSTAAADFASHWGTWYMNPDDPSAEEPPEGPQRQMELYDQILATVDEDEQIELMNELLEILKDEFYSIGISRPAAGAGVVKNNFHNVPDEMFNSTSWPTPGPTNPIQYFMTDDASG